MTPSPALTADAGMVILYSLAPIKALYKKT